MLSKIDVVLKISSTLSHISQIVTGFYLLKKAKKITLKTVDATSERNLPHDLFIEARINGHLVGFDVCDGVDTDMDIDRYFSYLDTSGVEFVFLRSFSKDILRIFPQQHREKMFPLGMNYHVSFYRNPLNSVRYCAGGVDVKLKKLITNFAKFLFGISKSISVKSFETKSKSLNNPHKILFFARLWKPEDNLDNRGFEECKQINMMRISIIRKLKEKYPQSFIGGLEDTSYTRETAPDLIVNKKFTKKKNYLKTMKNSDICIASMGLHKSIGWKNAEYVAAGRAIVCEQLYYDVPGDFSDGKNYLSFKNADECIEKVSILYENPKEILKMQNENKKYYNDYLKPDSIIMNAIKKVLELTQ